MAGEPKRKHSKSRKRTRRAAISQVVPHLIACKNCGKPTLSHIVCKECGYYASKSVGKEQVKVTKA
ncbi:50S ribosomal protein L32 [Candidatus Daviesbacteria bacterium]|nr:50S ribosomal protein L32 [Candidatus Daviesbacteria bacterium]